MKLLLRLIIALTSLQVVAKDLSCACEDRSTSTLHELNFHFASEKSAKVTLFVTSAAGSKEIVCRTDKNFDVIRNGQENLKFKGTFKCPHQSPEHTEIGFDASTMSLPNDTCHEGAVFNCKWST